MNREGEEDIALWSEEDGFFYDVLHLPDGKHFPLKVRSLVGLIPLLAIMTIDQEVLDKLPGFKKRFLWFLEHRGDLCQKVACMKTPGMANRRLLSIVNQDRLRKILSKLLDETEFLSDYGIRSISAFHRENPFVIQVNGHRHQVYYEPGESLSGLFGGNSNWRGPIWFPINYLIIESLQKFHYYLGDDFQVDCPTGSKNKMNLWGVATELSHRLIRLFTKDEASVRAIYSSSPGPFQKDPDWSDHILFFEYFHGDTGRGVGASHQTGWTGLVAKLIQQCGKYCSENQPTTVKTSAHS